MENHEIEEASSLLHIVAYEMFGGKSQTGEDKAVCVFGGVGLYSPGDAPIRLVVGRDRERWAQTGQRQTLMRRQDTGRGQ